MGTIGVRLGDVGGCGVGGVSFCLQRGLLSAAGSEVGSFHAPSRLLEAPFGLKGVVLLRIEVRHHPKYIILPELLGLWYFGIQDHAKILSLRAWKLYERLGTSRLACWASARDSSASVLTCRLWPGVCKSSSWCAIWAPDSGAVFQINGFSWVPPSHDLCAHCVQAWKAYKRVHSWSITVDGNIPAWPHIQCYCTIIPRVLVHKVMQDLYHQLCFRVLLTHSWCTRFEARLARRPGLCMAIPVCVWS